MKKIFVFGVLLLIVGVSLKSYVPLSKEKINTDPQTKETEQVLQAENEYVEPKEAFAWFSVKPNEKMELFSNVDDKLTSHDAKETYSCEKIVNAGFYSKENEHIGLFKNHEGTVSEYQTNSLFNGVFTKDTKGQFAISTDVQSADIALQTGPILVQNSEPLELNLKSDKAARRTVAAINSDGDLIFFVFYDSQSVFNGPYLRELPQMVLDASDDFELNIVDAINLDGGSASAFITDNVNLRELSPIGGFFCINGTEIASDS